MYILLVMFNQQKVKYLLETESRNTQYQSTLFICISKSKVVLQIHTNIYESKLFFM